MRVAVIGSGLQAKAACYDLLSQKDVAEVHLADISREQLESITGVYKSPRLKPAVVNAGNPFEVATWLKKVDAVLSAVPYHLNGRLTEAAVVSKTHFCDLGGNNDIVELQRRYGSPAKKLGVSIVPAVGLAPGLPAVLAAHAMADFDKVDEMSVRVGGLPQSKDGLLGYSVVFSVEGLVNEYIEPARVLKNGKPALVQSLTGLEELTFPAPVGDLEAFVTSGALSTLPDTFAGRIRSLNYKTIRYPGHANFFVTMKQLGLLGTDPIKVDGTDVRPRRVFETLAPRALGSTHADVVLMRATVKGILDGRTAERTYELVDYPSCGHTAMMRCTAFPASTTLLMLARGQVSMKGFAPLEESVDPKKFLQELADRGIRISILDSLG